MRRFWLRQYQNRPREDATASKIRVSFPAMDPEQAAHLERQRRRRADSFVRASEAQAPGHGSMKERSRGETPENAR